MATVQALSNTNTYEYPRFNDCKHTFVDLSHLDPQKGEFMHTFSIKLPNNHYVTLCVMQSGKEESCVDVQFYRGSSRIPAKAIGFMNGTADIIKDKMLYTIVVDQSGEEQDK
ncbi:hypothetical protein [Parageobacillus galactosidasius]|uniref:Uncharacterized protein n=1 Tax=Parageobacillus galactosidasius TaxID=883812 RepID=A0A226QTK5_9BACL|nr:hypothetical protein [Parageobacillus galactosidasius]OXB94832.1 hypothetical protein B9L23_08195 [Parageobacillus galactosidasius]